MLHRQRCARQRNELTVSKSTAKDTDSVSVNFDSSTSVVTDVKKYIYIMQNYFKTLRKNVFFC